MKPAVLIVEESTLLLHLYTLVLESLDCRVIQARLLEEAYRALEEHLDQIRLILTSDFVHDGEGLFLARIIRLTGRQIPVILVARDHYSLRSDPNANAVAEIIVKPVNRNTLERTVRRYLGPD